MSDDPDRLVTLTTEHTEFAANVKVAVLADAGIEAKVFGSLGTAIGATGQAGPPMLDVEVKVRASDAARATMVLATAVADSVDIDWDEVDVGERVDDLPLTPAGHTPAPAMIAMVLVAALLLAGIVMAVIIAAST